jgi:hypothetical protein
MLDPWIIEEIRRREDDRRREREAARIELPLKAPDYRESEEATAPEGEKDPEERGVAIIDL